MRANRPRVWTQRLSPRIAVIDRLVLERWLSPKSDVGRRDPNDRSTSTPAVRCAQIAVSPLGEVYGMSRDATDLLEIARDKPAHARRIAALVRLR
jgi:hypothetical protein